MAFTLLMFCVSSCKFSACLSLSDLFFFFLIENQVTLQELDNEMSRELMGLLKKQRESDRSYYQTCHLVRQGEQPREGFFLLANLIEDPVGGSIGYQDWILQLHRQVQQNA